MRLLVVGGGLQGVEALFLAREAGWETTLIDRAPAPPARDLAGSFRRLDALKATEAELEDLFGAHDVVLPALEDQEVIDRLASPAWSGRRAVVAIDPAAYRLSASKPASKELFERLGLPMAAPWRPGAPGGFVVKPAGLSGSRGVRYFESSKDLEAAIPDAAEREDLVIESRLDGPQYSIEVTARDGAARAWQTTRLEMDELSDCRLVAAPSGLEPRLELEFGEMAAALAKETRLTGLMDLEAVLHEGRLRLLEIDARLPSQTPTAVWRSTGVNLLVELVRCFTSLDEPEPEPGPPVARAKVVYEHVRRRHGVVTRHGEHVMTTMGPLRPERGFLGAETALVAGTDDDLVATLIFASAL